MFYGFRGSVLPHKKALGVGLQQCEYTDLLNCVHLKTVKMINFYVICIFTMIQNKKIKMQIKLISTMWAAGILGKHGHHPKEEKMWKGS